MEEAGSAFSWFMAYLICGVLMVVGVAAWIMVWQYRKHKHERQTASRKARARVRAWRAGKPTASQQAKLDKEKSR